jgi:type VI secretion system protein ImpA
MSKAKTTSSPQTPQPDWRLPITDEIPCGPSLEYDPEYAVLMSRLAPRGEAQYGSFVDIPERPNWAEIERDCRRLLLRTKDIHLYVWLARARTRLTQAAGLAQTLTILADVLQAWPEAIHPQLMIEGHLDPEVRANALAELADPEGLLADVREIAVVANTALRLTVRDVERAFAIPRSADAPSQESVNLQLNTLRATGDTATPIHFLIEAAHHAQAINDWAQHHLGRDAPPLNGLLRVLNLFVGPEAINPA